MIKQTLVVGSTFVCLLLVVAQVQAQLDRTFVSTSGNDASNCALSTPCRTFTSAVTKTNAKGEVIALDSGVYEGNIVINKSLTLTAAPGIHAELLSITQNATDCISVIAAANDTVVLQNLYLSRLPGGGGYGVNVQGVGVMHIDNLTIDGFNEGIDFILTAAAQVTITNTTIRNSLANGITFSTTSGFIRAAIDNSYFQNNGSAGTFNGVNLTRRSKVTVRNSVASGNTGAGFLVLDGELSLTHCQSSNNQEGVVATSNQSSEGNALVSNTIVTHNNQNGFRQTGTSVFESLGNNLVRKNGTNKSGTIKVISGI